MSRQMILVAAATNGSRSYYLTGLSYLTGSSYLSGLSYLTGLNLTHKVNCGCYAEKEQIN